ncbi:protein kinase, partial [Mycobacterium sp. ITM-2017-0098]
PPDMFAQSPSNTPWNPPSAPPVAPKKDRKKTVVALAAAAAAALLVIGTVVIVAATRDTGGGGGGGATSSAQPTAATQPGWRQIADARTALAAAAATQADGTIWLFGGMGADNRVSGTHEGYDPAIDSWKGGEDLPVPVQRAMSVTWQDTPVVLGGWRTEGANAKVATDQVWRVVNSRWMQLPPLLQPRAAAAAAVVGDRIVVTGGVDAGGRVLNTTEVYDGTGWTLGAPMPTP